MSSARSFDRTAVAQENPRANPQPNHANVAASLHPGSSTPPSPESPATSLVRTRSSPSQPPNLPNRALSPVPFTWRNPRVCPLRTTAPPRHNPFIINTYAIAVSC